MVRTRKGCMSSLYVRGLPTLLCIGSPWTAPAAVLVIVKMPKVGRWGPYAACFTCWCLHAVLLRLFLCVTEAWHSAGLPAFLPAVFPCPPDCIALTGACHVPKAKDASSHPASIEKFIAKATLASLWSKHECQLYMKINVSGWHWFCMVPCIWEGRWFRLRHAHGLVMKMNESLVLFYLLIFHHSFMAS